MFVAPTGCSNHLHDLVYDCVRVSLVPFFELLHLSDKLFVNIVHVIWLWWSGTPLHHLEIRHLSTQLPSSLHSCKFFLALGKPCRTGFQASVEFCKIGGIRIVSVKLAAKSAKSAISAFSSLAVAIIIFFSAFLDLGWGT